MGLTLLLQLMVIYIPALQSVFGTVALSAGDLGLALVLSSVIFWAAEVEKWWARMRATNPTRTED